MSVVLKKLTVRVAEQRLEGFDAKHQKAFEAQVSTARNGVGQRFGSECTPLGEHRIRAKIGADAPENAVFVGRRATGEIYTPCLSAAFPQRDWILTRILWLCGTQLGFNRGGLVDTQRRYIYLHGCPDSHPMGQPSSHGCVKMRNRDIMTLFDLVEIGTQVQIVE
ncbi:peptidase [Arenicella chitinivorans]|uniref:Peptidase n=1 Tax=Arenicella chitinivorans TaxID=1329800 RepID=A0A918VPW2_9GAMM|nr:L,D-transpeptidase [Arenicella chitinivorans]GHA15514.1 peptidase [Arenicella chitinivorans]